jgi:hypothetical protein
MEESMDMIIEGINDWNVLEAFLAGTKYNSKRMKRAAFEHIKKMFQDQIIDDFFINEPLSIKILVSNYRKIKKSKTKIENELSWKRLKMTTDEVKDELE